VPVDRHRLQGLGVNQKSCQQFAATQNTAELNLVEFFHASSNFPIAFIQQKNKDYRPCVVLGIKQAENLFVDDDGQWLNDIYSPAYIRRFPFLTQTITSDELKKDAKDLRKPVFVDEAALVKEAPHLFIGNGVATEHWQVIDSFVSEYISAERQTLIFTQKLSALNLLEPFNAQIHPNQGEGITLKGLYRINEDKINALSANVIKELMNSGYLSRIYAHLISLENFAKLLDRQARK